ATLSGDDNLVFQSANSFYGDLVGRKPSEIIGKPLLLALPEIKDQGFDKLLKEVLATGKAFIANEVPVDLFRTGKLEKVYVNLTYQPRTGIKGGTSGVLVVATDVTQQVESRKQVEESETKLRAIVSTAPAGIGLFVGRDLIIENPNQTFIDIVGKGPGIVGLPLREAMPELLTEGQPFLKILDDVYTTGIPFISPASLVKIVQNGILTENYYNISYSPVHDAKGDVYAILDIAIDVTEQVKAKRKLEESEQHLELLSNTVPAMIFYLDSEQRYQSYNETFMRWFSVNEKEAIGKTVLEFIGEGAYAKVLPHLSRAYAGHQERYEMESPARSDQKDWLSIVYTPHINEEGKVLGIIVHATDITQSKQAEMALRESENRFRTLAETLPQMVWMMDAEGNIEYGSKQWKEYSGVDDMREAWDYMMHPNDKFPVTEHWKEIFAKGKEYHHEMRLKDSTGEYRWFHSAGIPVKNETGKVIKWIGALTDIHEQKLFSEKLEKLVDERTKELYRSNEDLQQFAHVASHDLKEPVRKIRIFGGRLAQEFAKDLPEKAKMYLNKIESAATRAYAMIDGVLIYSSLDGQDLLAEKLDLDEMIGSIESDLEVLISQKGATIHHNGLPEIEGSFTLIYQLFYNLVNNSLKFSRDDRAPLIEIRSEAVHATDLIKSGLKENENAYVKLIVRDNGIGFSEGEAGRIFKTFSRLHSKDQYEGTGLGLALCKKIVERHRGAISASGEENIGAIFEIILPRSQ
ncbi:MAG: PAS domain-containing protein, partial [Chitinophagaceae bacterium]